LEEEERLSKIGSSRWLGLVTPFQMSYLSQSPDHNALARKRRIESLVSKLE
jgi:hypothetical protein